ncbi:GlxA family transcriptional regulator [Streptomyces sp. AK010]|uniref:GlxA family transcriptional regulator n=1 Tax=Streptomyces sp. AK010 TaxID=2723074 RepID=UPI001623040C|nr:DJ-1/PfpI family protein [Streptomyces sp. AK010]MBB6420437.1 transcriptional regulator GlxA family with amidase domain [Streptomyces sp. AK010]
MNSPDHTSGQQPHLVLILLFDGVQSLGFSGPADVFAAAGELSSGACRYEVRTASLDGGSVRASGGLTVRPDHGTTDVAVPGTLIVPGTDGIPALDRAIVDAVGSLARRARRVASVGTGAFLLADAGLLDGRRAATHWEFADELAHRYPDVEADARDTVVRDGRVTTAGGAASGLDLALALVEDDLGGEAAQQVARSLVTYRRRPGGQLQFAEPLGPEARSPVLRAVQRRILAEPGSDLSIRSLSRQAGISERHFTRLFRAQVGMSAREYIERARVVAASRLLTETLRSPEVIARETGFGTQATMLRSFRRVLRISPLDYRERFS